MKHLFVSRVIIAVVIAIDASQIVKTKAMLFRRQVNVYITKVCWSKIVVYMCIIQHFVYM